MKKKLVGGAVAIIIVASIATSHKPATPTPASVVPASQTTLATTAPSTTTPAQPKPNTAPDNSTSAATPSLSQVPVASTPDPTPHTCNPNYSPCIPNSPTDLDCPDVGMRVTVTGTDVYHLDADHDGIGCESY